MDLDSKIKKHHDAVLRFSSERERYRRVCPVCENSSGFVVHDVRPRELRYDVGNEVRSQQIRLVRWRCGECKRTFTDYPPFRFTL